MASQLKSPTPFYNHIQSLKSCFMLYHNCELYATLAFPPPHISLIITLRCITRQMTHTQVFYLDYNTDVKTAITISVHRVYLSLLEDWLHASHYPLPKLKPPAPPPRSSSLVKDPCAKPVELMLVTKPHRFDRVRAHSSFKVSSQQSLLSFSSFGSPSSSKWTYSE